METGLNAKLIWTPELEEEVRSSALGAGFQLCGVAPADSGPANGRFAEWVDEGRAGEMDYLKRRNEDGVLLRSGLKVAIPWAESVIVCALNYDSDEPLSLVQAPAGAGWVGRYAWSGRRNGDNLLATDYHDELLSRLRSVESLLRDRIPCETRCYVDTGPIVEREFAAKAGIGWIGKNTCVLNQELGSWLLLGVIVTSLPMAIEAALAAAPDRCGSCTRCIDACPTDALIASRQMDASRCIAYLTIEKKGEIATELRAAMGRQVFGCDICQDVCPWNTRHRDSSGNRHLPAAVTAGMEPRPELVNPSLEWLASIDAKEFKRWFKGSPLERTGRKRLHRNVAIAMGNSADAAFIPRLEAWFAGDDPVLAEAARWALRRLRSPDPLC